MLEDKIVTAEVIRFDAAENIFVADKKFIAVKNLAEVKFVAKNILKCADKFLVRLSVKKFFSAIR